MSEIDRLLGIMARLRDPDDGCPWDLEQDFASIAPYTIEEAYEVDHAIREGDLESLREELGDLLLQVVYHARMAQEGGHFDFAMVARTIGDKLVSRHPHVFGDEPVAGSSEDQRQRWEAYKEAERAHKRAKQSAGDRSAAADPDPFEGVPHALPALARAAKLQRREQRMVSSASREPTAPWETARACLERIRPATLVQDRDGQAAARSQLAADEVSETIGELLFSLVRLSSMCGHDAESALRDANAEFERRVRSRLESDES
jgi:ATP diphosphatase